MIAECPEDWMTRGELDAALARFGIAPAKVTDSKMALWRRKELLQRATQCPKNYRGSETIYPASTPTQLAEIIELLNEKRKFKLVGWKLWWRGRGVGQKWWKPDLKRVAASDIELRRALLKAIRSDEAQDRDRTLYDDLAENLPPPNILLSRPLGRLDVKKLPEFFSVVSDAATGRFTGFEYDPNERSLPSSKKTMVEGLGIESAKKHQIKGQKLKLVEVLDDAFTTISKSSNPRIFARLQNFTDKEACEARDLVRDGLLIGERLYRSTQWIFGSNAFGLKYPVWINQKMSQENEARFIVALIALRRAPNDFYSPAEVSGMARQAEKLLAESMLLKQLYETDPRFEALLAPRILRSAMSDHYVFSGHLEKIADAANML